MNKRGYTVIELLIVLTSVAVLSLVLLTMANVWVTDSGALRCARGAVQEVSEVTDIQRNIFSKTRVSAKTKEGKRVLVDLDADVFFNATCTFVAKE